MKKKKVLLRAKPWRVYL